jgi:hypothetical protein
MNNPANQRGRGNDDSVRELDFDDDSKPPPKAGDPRVPPGEPDPEISSRRVRDAGMTGGEAGRDVTDDDLTPETLLDEEQALDKPADKRVRVVDGDEIGAGYGLDEAELARRGRDTDTES